MLEMFLLKQHVILFSFCFLFLFLFNVKLYFHFFLLEAHLLPYFQQYGQIIETRMQTDKGEKK